MQIWKCRMSSKMMTCGNSSCRRGAQDHTHKDREQRLKESFHYFAHHQQKAFASVCRGHTYKICTHKICIYLCRRLGECDVALAKECAHVPGPDAMQRMNDESVVIMAKH